MAERVAEALDGRLHRTVRSRQAICDACLDLIEEGVLQPSADQIAERAGLSRRSVFNHFGDLAELYDAVVEAGTQRSASLLREIPPADPLAERVAAFAEVQSKFLEAMAPFTRALTAQSLVGPANDQARRVSIDALRRHQQQVERLFGAELAHLPAPERVEVVEALAVATSAPQWECLRRGRGLSMPRSRAVVQRTLAALLRDACARGGGRARSRGGGSLAARR